MFGIQLIERSKTYPFNQPTPCPESHLLPGQGNCDILWLRIGSCRLRRINSKSSMLWISGVLASKVGFGALFTWKVARPPPRRKIEPQDEKKWNVQALPGVARRFQGPRLLKLRAGFCVISACLLLCLVDRPMSAFASLFPLLHFSIHLLIFLSCSIVEAVDHFLVVRDLQLRSY